MNKFDHEREPINRNDDFKALSADELARIEGGFGLGDAVRLIQQAADFVKSLGRPTV